MVLASIVFSTHVRNSFVDGVKVILSSSGIIINVVVLFIWVCLVAMSLSNAKKDSSLNLLVLVIWIDQHILVIACGIEVVINELLFLEV
jgi:hypothetical protein